MGYSIYIGNAIPKFERTEYDELYAAWQVETAEDVKDPLGENNHFQHSYTWFAEFLKRFNLYDLFLEQKYYHPSEQTEYWEEGLMFNHPGCVIIKEYHYLDIKNALDKYKLVATKEAGYEDGQDHILALLMRLEFWFRYALDNCEVPAIYNM